MGTVSAAHLQGFLVVVRNETKIWWWTRVGLPVQPDAKRNGYSVFSGGLQ